MSASAQEKCGSEAYDQMYQCKSSELNKPELRGEERETDNVRGQPGSSISLCACRAVGGRHNHTETQIENRQGREDTETGE